MTTLSDEDGKQEDYQSWSGTFLLPKQFEFLFHWNKMNSSVRPSCNKHSYQVLLLHLPNYIPLTRTAEILLAICFITSSNLTFAI